jgi:hypothetical protein
MQKMSEYPEKSLRTTGKAVFPEIAGEMKPKNRRFMGVVVFGADKKGFSRPVCAKSCIEG